MWITAKESFIHGGEFRRVAYAGEDAAGFAFAEGTLVMSCSPTRASGVFSDRTERSSTVTCGFVSPAAASLSPVAVVNCATSAVTRRAHHGLHGGVAGGETIVSGGELPAFAVAIENERVVRRGDANAVHDVDIHGQELVIPQHLGGDLQQFFRLLPGMR